ncbi:DUF3306 domain-containing protein [Sagittula sp. NFXS13]|uniref:DUF3306 domain-containing protein n=1 Tax=Sagittula sp. NFXS13 TaxID=2819095 RepID=UPI0032DFCD04
MSRSFWERRRAGVVEEARAEEAAQVAAVEAAQEQALAERSDDDLLAEAGMPEPDALASAEQVQAFLKSTLPQRLKTRALRRLWRLNPVLANLDGLLEYGEDYTDSATVIENMQTVYQVGKGMFDKAEEAARAAEARAQDALAKLDDLSDDADAPEGSQRCDDELPDPPTQLATAEPNAEDTAPDHFAYETDIEEPPLPVTARRMRFRFDDMEGRT